MTKQKRSLKHKVGRIGTKLLVRWIRFGKAHQNSHRLPVFLFLVLFLDAFVMVIPALVFLVASITISPKRWKVFALVFTAAGVAGNVLTYFAGRIISPDTIVSLIERFNLENVWQQAERALHSYGPWAAFLGVLIGLPVQMVMVMIGIADAQILRDDPSASSSFVRTILFALIAHAIKGFLIAGLTRFGWVKLEKKFENQIKT